MQRLEPKELYEQYGDQIYRFCYRLSGNRADAEDLAAETFNSVLRKPAGFEGRSSVSTYLLQVARNRWRMHVRRERIRRLLTRNNEAEHTEIDLDQMALSLAVDTLSPKLKEAFLLVKAEGLTNREAAEVLGCPVGTVQARVFAAMKKVRESLTDTNPHAIAPDSKIKEARS